MLTASIIKARGIERELGFKVLLRQWLTGIPSNIEISTSNEPNKENSRYKLLVASPKLSNSKILEAISRIAVAIAKGLGYKVVNLHSSPGLIVLEYSELEE